MGDKKAIKKVGELLQQAQLDAIFARTVAEQIAEIESIDRLIETGEVRRDAFLAQIYNRKAHLGAKLRNAIKQIEQKKAA